MWMAISSGVASKVRNTGTPQVEFLMAVVPGDAPGRLPYP